MVVPNASKKIKESNDYDAAARYLIRMGSRAFWAWLIREELAEIYQPDWFDTRRHSFPGRGHRTNDTVLEFALNYERRQPRLNMIEVESYPSAELGGRIVEYTGLLMREKPNTLRGDRYLVGAVVVALSGRSQAGCDFRTAKGNGLVNSPIVHNLSEIDATTIMDNVETNPHLWPLLAWLPLMYGGNETAAMVRFRTMLENWPDPFQKSLLKTQAIVYAGLPGQKSEWKQLLKEINVIRSPYAEELRMEGRIEERLNNVMDILRNRFGDDGGPNYDELEQYQDLHPTSNLVVIAATIGSLQEFKEMLAQSEVQPESE